MNNRREATMDAENAFEQTLIEKTIKGVKEQLDYILNRVKEFDKDGGSGEDPVQVLYDCEAAAFDAKELIKKYESPY